MSILYDIFFLVFCVFYVPALLVKGKSHKGFAQKFGAVPESVTRLKSPVWIHAVSVGEAAVASRLASAIKSVSPETPIVVSTTTRTGNEMIKRSGGEAVDAVFYYPLDFRAVVRRVIRKVGPALYIMVETELWPNMLEALRSAAVPVILANGRISDRSFRNYSRIRPVTRRMLGNIDAACVQTETDALKIRALGAPASNVFVCGNIKFDAVLPGSEAPTFTKEQLGFGREDRVLIAGSTHFPEENIITDIFSRLRSTFGNVKLVIAPRHVERKDAIRIYAEKTSLSNVFLSDALSGKGPPLPGTDVVIVDTIGDLSGLYGIADMVFIGGSMSGKGGQNPIEAALWKKPVILGPDMSNFREISDVFLKNKAVLKVNNARELEDALRSLLEDPLKAESMAEAAGRVIKENSGAARKTAGISIRYKRSGV